jgi:hypothetical protein
LQTHLTKILRATEALNLVRFSPYQIKLRNRLGSFEEQESNNAPPAFFLPLARAVLAEVRWPTWHGFLARAWRSILRSKRKRPDPGLGHLWVADAAVGILSMQADV